MYDDVYLSVDSPSQFTATYTSTFAVGSVLHDGVSVCGF
jgi:hypothetical protein